MNELAGRLGYLTVGDDWGTTEPPADLRAPVDPGDAAAGADGAGALGEGNGTGAAKDPGVKSGTGGGPVTGRTASADSAARAADGPTRSRQLGAALRAGMDTAHAGEAAQRWQAHARETFVAVAITKGARRPAEYWKVDLGHATVTETGPQAQDSSDWDVVGTLETWRKVISRQLNLSAALRSYELRYCDNGEPVPLTAADARLAILGRLLGLSSCQ